MMMVEKKVKKELTGVAATQIESVEDDYNNNSKKNSKDDSKDDEGDKGKGDKRKTSAISGGGEFPRASGVVGQEWR
jgi:hypothetical protein